MSRNRRNRKNESIDDDEVEDKRRGSVLDQKPEKTRQMLTPFAIQKRLRKPKIRNKILTTKQVHKLATLETYEIAKNHTYGELEFIVSALHKLYNQKLNLGKEEPEEEQKPKEEVKKTSGKKGRGRLNRLSIKRGKSSKRKSRRRSSVFSNLSNRRPSINFLKKLRSKKEQEQQKPKPKTKNKKNSLLTREQLAKYNDFELEKAIEKSGVALKTHQTYKKKQKEKWKTWEINEKEENLRCLLEMKAIVPKYLKRLKEEELTEELNGNVFLARRLLRHKVFSLLNFSLDSLQRIHPADFNNRYHIGGLDIVELRALFAHTEGLKREWRNKLRKKLFALTEKEKNGTLLDKEKRHPAYANKPSHNTTRKPSVVAFMNRRGSMASEIGNSNVISSVAEELQETVGQNTGSGKAAPPSLIRKRAVRRASVKREASRRQSEIEDIYLVKKAPDDSIKSKRNSRNRTGEVKSDDDRKRRRNKNNIFGAFEDYKSGKAADDDEEDDEEGKKSKTSKKEPVFRKDSTLEEYFAERDDSDEEEETKPERKRRESNFDYDEKEFEIQATDDEEEIKRKQSELFIKAFEMINSDEVHEDDEVFMKTIRKLSTFSSTMSESGFGDRLGDFDFDEALDEEEVGPSNPPPKVDPVQRLYNHQHTLSSFSTSSESSDTGDGIADIYLRPTRSYASIPESAFTEDDFRI